MLSELFDITITVKRAVTSGQNSLGEFNKTFTTIYTNIPARKEKTAPVTRTGKMEYRDSGQRKMPETIYYVPAAYQVIQEDQIFEGSTLVGLVMGVSNAKSPDGSNAVDHYEFRIEEL